MYSLSKIIIFILCIVSLCAARKACRRVPEACEIKCAEYKLDKARQCLTCQCVPVKGLYEDDIKLEEKTERILIKLLNPPTSKGAGNDDITKWTLYPDEKNNHYFIPYEIVGIDYAKTAIELAIADFHQHTCLRFIERTDEEKYISFFDGGGCWSYVGVIAGVNQVSIGNRCETKGIVIHEIMHALGFWHEQSRPDRDENIEILWDNIIEDKKHNFQKQNTIDSLGSPYDKKSAMHYPNWAFSKNGQPTIANRDSSTFDSYQREGFSLFDIEQINMLYKCGNVPTPTPTPQPTEEPCQDQLKAKKCKKVAKKNKCGKKIGKVKCQQTCGWCESDAPFVGDAKCVDDSPMYCFALSHRCTTNDDVLIDCPSTCGIC